MTKRMFIMLGSVVLLIAVLAFGKFLQIKQLIASAPKAGAQTVSAAKAEVLEWQPQISAVGTVSAFRGVDLSSEVTGLVREVLFKSGQYVNTGDKLVTLQTIDPVYVDFFVPQKQISSLKVGQNLKVASDAFAGQAFEGQVSFINPKVDTSRRNVQVQATLSNQKQALLPGMFANVALDVGDKNKFITLPQTAITYNPYGSTVFVIKDDNKKDDKGNPVKVAQQVFVTTGATRGDQVAVLAGIEAGQIVVTSGQLKLKNGTPVLIDNSVQPKNSPNPTPQEH